MTMPDKINTCPCCGGGLSVNFNLGVAYFYCPDHGHEDENGRWHYAPGFDESNTNEPKPE